ncbi:threonine-phosphate decarboxylase [Thiocystis violacea]|nr:threonine-phosphate decarboxylase [Thiocystis violacea]
MGPHASPHHGGRLREAAVRFGRPLEDWLDLSTGINPLAWPVPVVPAFVWGRLPEDGDGLESAAAAYYGAPDALPLAGSQAAIQILPTLRPPGRVGIPEVGYQEHAHAWRRAGHEVVALANGDPGSLLDAGPDQFDCLVAINPNNPTGQVWPPELLLDWRARLAARGGWLVVDEAFMDTTPAGSLMPYVGLPGLLVLRSLGKFFGLAGARVGFLFAEPNLRERVARRLGPWTLAGPSRWIARQALVDADWQAVTRAALPAASARLAALLRRHGLAPAGGTALFQWVLTPEAERLQTALGERAILARHFEHPASLRFGLPGRASEWERLERALGSIAGDWSRGADDPDRVAPR